MMNRILSKVLCVAVFGFGLGTLAHAEPAGPEPKPEHREGPGKHLEKLKEDLQLTDDQTAKIKAVFESHKGEGEKIKDDSVLTKEEKREQLKALKDKVDAEINAILTPAQQQKFKEIQEKRREEFKEKMAEGRKKKQESGKPDPAPAQ